MIGFAVRSCGRLAAALLAFAVAWPFYMGFARQSVDEAVRAALDEALLAGRGDELARAALDRGDVDDASALADLARGLGRPLAEGVLAKLEAARAAEGRAGAGLQRCAEGALFGTMRDAASAACMLAVDFTVLGDLRDIAIQGGAWAAGRDYDRVILGLSAVGLGATALSAATAGAATPARAGLSLAKAARRAGQVPPALLRAVATELRLVAAGGDAARLARAAGAVDAVRREHGAIEAARMLRHAGTLDELGDVAGMYGRFGHMARPVMALTGRTSIHAFKAGYKVLPTVGPTVLLLVGSALLLVLGLALRGAIERSEPRRIEPWF